MSGYGWLISADLIKDQYDLALHYGPSNTTFKISQIYNGEPFRMYNRAGKLCYEGKITGAFTGREPLEDFGRPAGKCTEIRYMDPNTQEWVAL